MSLPKLELLSITSNLNGWGPSDDANHDPMAEFKDLPFQNFNRCERIGRISDWIGVERYFKKERYQDRGGYKQDVNAGSQFDYIHDTDENFQLVDSSRPQKPMQQRYRNRNALQFKKILTKDLDDRAVQTGKLKKSVAKEHMKQFKIWQKRGGNVRNQNGRPQNRKFGERVQRIKQPSVQVRSEWKIIEDLDFGRLNRLKLSSAVVGTGKDIEGRSYGSIHYYDRAVDRISPKTAVALKKIGGNFLSIPTIEDPIIEELTIAKTGNVYGTDIIIATLMSAARSVQSWDVVVRKVGNTIMFDKRGNVDTIVNAVDQLTVDETAPEPPLFDGVSINNAKELATEALYINQNFRRQVLKRSAPELYSFENKSLPLFEDYDATDFECAFKYRKFNLGNSKVTQAPITLICRTEVNGVMVGPNNEPQFMTIKAFNEWDSSLNGHVDWRKSLDTQKGSVLATEMRNNSCKIAKWALQAILAGTDCVKIGYVSRTNPQSNAQHVVLGVQNFKPIELAQNISLDVDNSWGVLKCIIDVCLAQDDGKYLLLKDPTANVVKFFSIPEETFETSDESEVSEGSDAE